MKIILKAKVKGIGNPGDVKDVSDGYARNYLLPKGLAIIADDAALRTLNQQLQSASKKDQRELTLSQGLKTKIENTPVSYKVKAGEGGRLFGSVTNQDIANHLAQQGIKIDRRKIHMDEPIRQLGSYELEIRLHPDVTATLSLTVEGE